MKNKLIKVSLLATLTLFTLNNVPNVDAAKTKATTQKVTKVKKTKQKVTKAKKTNKKQSKQTTPKLTGLPLDNNSSMISDGNEIKLTQDTKVNYVNISKKKIVKTKTVKKGTILYGFWSGQNGVNLCLYNPNAGIKITQNVWPSFSLTEDNAKVIAGYSNQYTYNTTMQMLYASSTTNVQSNQDTNIAQSNQNTNTAQSNQTSQDNNAATQNFNNQTVQNNNQ